MLIFKILAVIALITSGYCAVGFLFLELDLKYKFSYRKALKNIWDDNPAENKFIAFCFWPFLLIVSVCSIIIRNIYKQKKTRA